MEPVGSLPHSQFPATFLYPEPAQSQPNPVHTPTSHLLKIHPNIILPSTPGSPDWSLSFRFPHQKPIHASFLPHPRYMPHLSLDFVTRRILDDEYRWLSSSLWRFLHSPITSYLLGPHILLNTLFSDTLSLRSSLNISDQVSHPYNKELTHLNFDVAPQFILMPEINMDGST
jgi:hypothetical protein